MVFCVSHGRKHGGCFMCSLWQEATAHTHSSALQRS